MIKFFTVFLLSLGIATALYSQDLNSIAEQNVFCEWQGKNASASIDKGFIGKASYLYWQAKEDGLEFVQSIDLQINFPEPIIAKSSLVEPSSPWQNGFQVGIGYIFPQRSQWDVLLNWTWFYSKAKSSITANDPTLTKKSLRPTWLPFLMGPQAFDAASHWILKYDTLDLSLGRDFFLGKWLSFHPQAGVRAAHLRQNYQAKYHSVYTNGMGGFFPTVDSFFNAKWTYNGIGARLGSDAQWHVNSCFSFVANGFISMLYGKYKVQELFFGAFPVGAPQLLAEFLHVKQNYYRLRTALESELGIRLQRFFSKDSRRAVLGAYYGLSYWMRQNEMINQFLFFDNTTGDVLVTNLPVTGDLQLHGLRVALEVDF